MTRRNAILVALLLFLMGLRIGLAQDAPRLHLPHIANGQIVSSVCNNSTPLLNRDTGALSAIRDADGRYIIAYQDRQSGSRAFVAQHVGDHLEDIAAPQLALANLPDFSPPGVKHGALALVPSNVPGGKSRLYYTARVVDDTPNEGPYVIWCMEF
jgi:hypothetical protein